MMPAPLLVLIVDDVQVNLNLASYLLTGAGFNVITTQSPAHALDLISRCTPDLVLVDQHMPQMRGSELIAIMLAGATTPESVLLFSATMTDEAQGEVISRLGIGRVSKGVTPQRFLTDVVDALQRAGCQVPDQAIALATAVVRAAPTGIELGRLSEYVTS